MDGPWQYINAVREAYMVDKSEIIRLCESITSPQGMARGVAMKGEIEALNGIFDILQNMLHSNTLSCIWHKG
jgi:hypothetical protein